MKGNEFLRPRLCGTRFEGGGIPLEILSDLAVLKEMLIEVAKWKFLQAHPDRQRSPRGFTEGIELKLSGVEAGSAVPIISLSDTSSQLSMMPRQNLGYFEQAREALVSTIGAAEHNGSATSHLPEEYLAYFNRIGRSLRDNESIEFVTPQHSTQVRLTRKTRHRLILASSKIKEIAEEVVLRGSIPEADQDRRTFELQLIHGHKVPCPIPDPHIDTILKAFNGYRENLRVLLQGIGKYDRQNRLVGVEAVEHISLLDPLDVPARLDEFRDMKDGWLEGEGVAPSMDGLDWLASTFDRHFPDDLPLPYLYPTPEGGVEAEWSLGSQSVIFEIDLATHRDDWLCFDKQSDCEDTRLLNLDTADSWAWLVTEIRRLKEAGK